jgi:hypothetical protein
LNIFRVQCKICKTTHAIIPSFSLPGTSIGAFEAEFYLKNRENGISKIKSGNIFVSKGLSFKYYQSFEKMILRAFNNAKSIFPNEGDHTLSVLNWIQSIIGNSENPISDFNEYCLANSINAVFCPRFNILIFKKNKSGSKLPHKIRTSEKSIFDIDSS